MTEARRRGPITVAALALLALHAALAWIVRAPALRTANDDAVYLLLGRAVRQLSYRDLFLAGTPVQAQYPPLYPTFLALLGLPAGERLDLFLAANIVWSTLALWLFFRALRRRSDVVALLGLALAATNPRLIAMAGQLRSEPMLMALVALALVGLARAGPSRRTLAVSGAAAIAAALTRSIGVTVVAGLIGTWLLERHWRASAGLLLAALALVGPWLAWTAVAPGQVAGRSYLADLTYRGPEPTTETGSTEPGIGADPVAAPGSPSPSLVAVMARRVAGNLVEYGGRGVPESLGVPGLAGSKLDNLAWLVTIVGLGALGLVVFARWWRAAALTLVVYGALLAVWPYPVGRFLVPVLPLLLFALLAGAAEVGLRVAARAGRWRPHAALPALLAGLVMAGALPLTVGLVTAQNTCDRSAPLTSPGCADEHELRFFEATRWIANNTSPSERFLTAKEGTFYYYAGRQAVLVATLESDPALDLRRFLEAHAVRYVLLGHLKYDETGVVARLLPICEQVEVVRAWGPGTLLLLVDGEIGPPRPDACEALHAYNGVPWRERAPRVPLSWSVAPS